MSKLLCWLGLHNWSFSSKFLPSMGAVIVTDYIVHVECGRCTHVREHHHYVWDGGNFNEKLPC